MMTPGGREVLEGTTTGGHTELLCPIGTDAGWLLCFLQGHFQIPADARVNPLAITAEICFWHWAGRAHTQPGQEGRMMVGSSAACLPCPRGERPG